VLFRPLERAPDAWSWRTADGSVLDADAVVAHCLDLLGHDEASTAADPGVALPAACRPSPAAVRAPVLISRPVARCAGRPLRRPPAPVPLPRPGIT
jgi:hypothetical protein